MAWMSIMWKRLNSYCIASSANKNYCEKGINGKSLTLPGDIVWKPADHNWSSDLPWFYRPCLQFGVSLNSFSARAMLLQFNIKIHILHMNSIFFIEAKRVGGFLSRFWCLFCRDVVIWYVSLVTFIINQRPVASPPLIKVNTSILSLPLHKVRDQMVTVWVPTIVYLLIFVTAGICPKILYIRMHQLHICTSWQT